MKDDSFSILIFLSVWIGCMFAGGLLGFMLGWLPAIILGYIWPLILAGAVVVAIVIALVFIIISIIALAL